MLNLWTQGALKQGPCTCSLEAASERTNLHLLALHVHGPYFTTPWTQADFVESLKFSQSFDGFEIFDFGTFYLNFHNLTKGVDLSDFNYQNFGMNAIFF